MGKGLHWWPKDDNRNLKEWMDSTAMFYADKVHSAPVAPCPLPAPLALVEKITDQDHLSRG